MPRLDVPTLLSFLMTFLHTRRYIFSLTSSFHLLVLLHFHFKCVDVSLATLSKCRWLINSMAFCTSIARKWRYFIFHLSFGRLWLESPMEIVSYYSPLFICKANFQEWERLIVPEPELLWNMLRSRKTYPFIVPISNISWHLNRTFSFFAWYLIKNTAKLYLFLIYFVFLPLQAVSCDEAFLELFLSLNDYPESIAELIRKEIYETTRCTASAGIGENMLLARLATKSAKPNGQCFIPPDKVKHFN